MSNLPAIRSKEIKEFYEQLEKEIDKQMGEVRGIFGERRKSMTVADLKAMLKNMPDDAEITADKNVIERVTADIDLNGNIERVDLVLK